jgi:ubiquinone/menaquinone biosynthesis C-methylase UbiE
MKDRSRVIPSASGAVLELGCGGGANLQFYDWGKVTQLSGIDPSPQLMERAHVELAKAGRSAYFLPGIAEALPFPDNHFDTVVTTFTLCSVQDQTAALAETRRVLKPGGRLLFVEHGSAPDSAAAKWQRRIEPAWKHIAGGCHLTRPVTHAISAAGFVTHGVQGHYIKRTPQWLGWVEWGEAQLQN